MERIRRHVLIEGRVQGVWFRGSTREQALAHGVCGFARNLSDGRVEAVFEGSPEAVAALLRYCHEGPPGARVRQVIVHEEEPEGLEEFRIGESGAADLRGS